MDTNGPPLLRTWLTAQGIRQAELARRLGITPTAVCDWLRGQRRPGRDLACRLEGETGGAVRVSDWSAPVVAPVEFP